MISYEPKVLKSITKEFNIYFKVTYANKSGKIEVVGHTTEFNEAINLAYWFIDFHYLKLNDYKRLAIQKYQSNDNIHYYGVKWWNIRKIHDKRGL